MGRRGPDTQLPFPMELPYYEKGDLLAVSTSRHATALTLRTEYRKIEAAPKIALGWQNSSVSQVASLGRTFDANSEEGSAKKQLSNWWNDGLQCEWVFDDAPLPPLPDGADPTATPFGFVDFYQESSGCCSVFPPFCFQTCSTKSRKERVALAPLLISLESAEASSLQTFRQEVVSFARDNQIALPDDFRLWFETTTTQSSPPVFSRTFFLTPSHPVMSSAVEPTRRFAGFFSR